MPVISVSMGKADKAQKKELIAKLTASAVEVTGIPASSFTVLIDEFDYESLGVGGRTLEEIFAEKA